MEWTKYIPLVLIALMTLLQIYIRFSARFMTGKMLPELQGVVDEKLLQGDKLVLYFSSAYCQPCKAMAPMIERLSNEFGTIVKLDALEHGELANSLHARGAPAFVFIESGRIAGVHLGALNETRLRAHL
ncbi:MAG: thioredoxin family protein [Gammaproteobacteria bacterium]|nr:thioredoxin family protein [Gammaproteobacteria bacterium]